MDHIGTTEIDLGLHMNINIENIKSVSLCLYVPSNT